MFNFKSKVLKKEQLTIDAWKFSFSIPQDFNFIAGQYVMLKIKEKKEDGTLEEKWRAYSILNPPIQKETLDLCIKYIPNGFATHHFETMKEGEEIEIKGPLGDFHFDETTTNEQWFIASGSGITPFYSMIHEFLPKKNNKFILLMSAKTEKELIFHKELQELEKKYSNFSYRPTLTREEWLGLMGRVEKHIPQTPEDLKNKTFYLCGVKESVLETEALFLDKGVSKENIKKERHT